MISLHASSTHGPGMLQRGRLELLRLHAFSDWAFMHPGMHTKVR